jgi:hypothetical protein
MKRTSRATVRVSATTFQNVAELGGEARVPRRRNVPGPLTLLERFFLQADSRRTTALFGAATQADPPPAEARIEPTP